MSALRMKACCASPSSGPPVSGSCPCCVVCCAGGVTVRCRACPAAVPMHIIRHACMHMHGVQSQECKSGRPCMHSNDVAKGPYLDVLGAVAVALQDGDVQGVP